MPPRVLAQRPKPCRGQNPAGAIRFTISISVLALFLNQCSISQGNRPTSNRITSHRCNFCSSGRKTNEDATKEIKKRPKSVKLREKQDKNVVMVSPFFATCHFELSISLDGYKRSNAYIYTKIILFF